MYLTHIIDTDNTQTTNQATDDILKSIVEQSNKENNQAIEIKNPNQNETAKQVVEAKPQTKTISSFKLNFGNLSNSEIIVASAVVGTIIALILGFVFCNYYGIYNGVKVQVNPEDYHRAIKSVHSEFNYLLGLGSFIISGGITYLFLKRQNNKETIKN